MFDLAHANATEVLGHKFEIIRLVSVGDHWFAQFAVDGRKYPPFYEPKANVTGMSEREFLTHLQAQSLTMMQYGEEAA
jgi:hypothetical protein